MNVIEKLKFDKEQLIQNYTQWIDGPGYIQSDQDSLRASYLMENYTAFLDWAYNEWHEFTPGDLTLDGSIVLDQTDTDIMRVPVINLFTTGWAYHLNRIKETHGDFEKPFKDLQLRGWRQELSKAWTLEKEEDLIDRISLILDAHAAYSHEPGHINVHAGLTPEEDRFYVVYDDLLRKVRDNLYKHIYHIDLSLVTDLM